MPNSWTNGPIPFKSLKFHPTEWTEIAHLDYIPNIPAQT